MHGTSTPVLMQQEEGQVEQFMNLGHSVLGWVHLMNRMQHLASTFPWGEGAPCSFPGIPGCRWCAETCPARSKLGAGTWPFPIF